MAVEHGHRGVGAAQGRAGISAPRSLAFAFTPARIEDTITRLTDSQNPPATDDHTRQENNAHLARCDKKLASYRAALDAGADPTVVTAWITRSRTNAGPSNNGSPQHNPNPDND